ncbi:MAG: hypothetical protein KDC57_15690 [Saprospiraceae bacterium]|nr:hypothetical protein [Saprospiraceae bacterium]
MFRLKLLPVLLATLWISLSEFVRNEYLLKSYWTSHYSQLGLTFPSAPVNGAIWGVWSLVFALVIFVLARKFSQWQTTLLAWVIGFVMMWLVIGNLAVLPFGILPAAIPLSLLEAFLATWIVRQFQRK